MRSHGISHRTPRWLFAVAAAIACATPAFAHSPLRRDLDAYFILASKYARLKNFNLDSACNIGVNCATPTPPSTCGQMIMEDLHAVDGAQLVADRAFCTKPNLILAQLFRNSGGPGCPASEPFVPPVIPDTCDPGCTPDIAALEALCGFPQPFPACDPAKPVTAQRGLDCAGVPDAVPGNGRCDLSPGTYGAVTVRNDAELRTTAGTYALCSFKVARRARVVPVQTTVLVSSGGGLRLGTESKVGFACGDLTILLKGPGSVNFGRHGNVAAHVCGPERFMRLGHGNSLIGQFVGDRVVADHDNHGACCAQCTCIDQFSPATAHVGDQVTMTGHCDLTPTTAVRICGIAAPIVSKTASVIVVTVPPGASGDCTVEVDSAPGTFEAAVHLMVN